MRKRLLWIVLAVLTATTAPPAEANADNGRRYFFGITNTFGVVAYQNFAATSGVIWHLETEMYFRHIILSPVLAWGRKEPVPGATTEFDSGAHSFFTLGTNIKYSFLGPGIWEPFIIGGVAMHVLDDDATFGPSLGFGLLINPLDQLGIMLNAYYNLAFGGDDTRVGDGTLTATGGLSFRW